MIPILIKSEDIEAALEHRDLLSPFIPQEAPTLDRLQGAGARRFRGAEIIAAGLDAALVAKLRQIGGTEVIALPLPDWTDLPSFRRDALAELSAVRWCHDGPVTWNMLKARARADGRSPGWARLRIDEAVACCVLQRTIRDRVTIYSELNHVA